MKLFEKLKSDILSPYDGGKKTLKNIGEKEAKRSIKNTQKQHKRALNGAYKIFLVPESLKMTSMATLIESNHIQNVN